MVTEEIMNIGLQVCESEMFYIQSVSLFAKKNNAHG